ncbi:MAG: prepilin peptidase [Candidatus Micrarchaeia archaeon]
MIEPMNYTAAAIAVIFSAACSYYDLFNRRNIPEKLLWAFLVAAVGASFILNGTDALANGAMQAAIIAVIGYLSYRAGQMGLADVFVLASIAILIPAVNLSADWGYAAVTFSVPAVLLVFFASVISFSYIMAAYYFAKIALGYGARRGHAAGIKQGKKTVFALGAIGIFALAYLFCAALLGIGAYRSAVAATFPALMFFFALFMPEIKESMVEQVAVGKLELEDVIAVEKMDQKAVQKYGIGRLIDSKNLIAIKKAGLKAVPVYTGMPPFLPFMLLGLLIVILFNGYIAAAFLPQF